MEQCLGLTRCRMLLLRFPKRLLRPQLVPVLAPPLLPWLLFEPAPVVLRAKPLGHPRQVGNLMIGASRSSGSSRGSTWTPTRTSPWRSAAWTCLWRRWTPSRRSTWGRSSTEHQAVQVCEADRSPAARHSRIPGPPGPRGSGLLLPNHQRDTEELPAYAFILSPTE